MDYIVSRIILGLVAIVAVDLLLGFRMMSWVISIGWPKSKANPRSIVACMARGAVVVGAIGFSIGFFGPMLFAHDANQGPLLGIFITGPIGFFLGGIIGLVVWWIRDRDSHPHNKDVDTDSDTLETR